MGAFSVQATTGKLESHRTVSFFFLSFYKENRSIVGAQLAYRNNDDEKRTLLHRVAMAASRSACVLCGFAHASVSENY